VIGEERPEERRVGEVDAHYFRAPDSKHLGPLLLRHLPVPGVLEKVGHNDCLAGVQ
jgi:hypothetical protein